MIKKNRSLLILWLIVGGGAFLRIFSLGKESFWLDEVASVDFAQKDLISIINLPIGEPHPPFYYIILHFWISVFGISEFAVRFPSVIFGILSSLMLYKVG